MPLNIILYWGLFIFTIVIIYEICIHSFNIHKHAYNNFILSRVIFIYKVVIYINTYFQFFYLCLVHIIYIFFFF